MCLTLDTFSQLLGTNDGFYISLILYDCLSLVSIQLLSLKLYCSLLEIMSSWCRTFRSLVSGRMFLVWVLFSPYPDLKTTAIRDQN